jgi:hypothetical protein
MRFPQRQSSLSFHRVAWSNDHDDGRSWSADVSKQQQSKESATTVSFSYSSR